MINVIVADDEPLALNGLCDMLRAHADIRIVAACETATSCITEIERAAPDAVFLDINMKDASGLDVADRISASVHRPLIVFVTAYAEHALDAFDVDATDYIVKPFSEIRLTATLNRLRKRVAERSAAGKQTAPGPRSFAVRTGEAVRYIPAADVEWIEAADYYVRLHVRGGCHLVRESLRQLAPALHTHGFFRTHRSALVNLLAVREIRGTGRNVEVVLRSGGTVPLARGRAAALRRALKSPGLPV
jgi:two-component system LytT family response regulator